MKRLEAGALVCMGRRNVKGQGIVIERIKNINDYANFDLSDAFYRSYDKKHPDYHFRANQDFFIYQARVDLHESINQEIIKRNPEIRADVLKHFWQYNGAYSVLNFGRKIIKPKTDFCLVMWTKAPSDYGSHPEKWYKDKPVWHHTRLLKML